MKYKVMKIENNTVPYNKINEYKSDSYFFDDIKTNLNSLIALLNLHKDDISKHPANEISADAKERIDEILNLILEARNLL